MQAQHDKPKASSTTGNVGGLIAEVEHKMSELMNWHKAQVSQFEDEKSKFENEMNLQRQALIAERQQQEESLNAQACEQQKAFESQRKTLEERMGKVEQQRIKLLELTSKLRAEESAMSREWGEVQKEREAIQKQANDIAKQREQLQERAKTWLQSTAAELSEPLKLTGADESEGSHEGDHHHEAA